MYVGRLEQVTGGCCCLATSVLCKQSPLVYNSSYRWFCFMALDESVMRNPTQPEYLLERGQLLLVSGGTGTHNHSHQMKCWEVNSYG